MNDMEKGEGTLKRSKTKGSSKKTDREDGDSSDEESELRIHKLTERERRKKMKNMFNDLHALLPQLPAKAAKCTIVDEAIKYISTLQETLKSLKKQEKKIKLQGKQPLGYQSVGSATPSEAIIGSTSHTPAHHPELPDQQQQLPLIVNDNDIVSGSAIGGPAVPVSFLTLSSPYVVLNKCGDGGMINVCLPRKPGLLSAMFNILYKHNLDVLSAQLFGDEHRCMYAIHARAAVGNSSGHLAKTLAAEDTFKLATDEMRELISSC